MNVVQAFSSLIVKDEFIKWYLNLFIYISLVSFFIMFGYSPLLKFSSRYYRIWKYIRKIPGPTVYNPIIGNLDRFLVLFFKKESIFQGVLNKFVELNDEFGKNGLYRIWYGPSLPIVLATTPETIQPILSSSGIEVNARSSFYYIFKTITGDGVFISHGQKWKYARRMITPFFNKQSLDKNIPIIIEHQNILFKKINKLIAQNNGICEDTYNMMSIYTLDTICDSLMGVKLNMQEKPAPEYLSALQNIFQLGLYDLMVPWLKYLPISKFNYISNSTKYYHNYNDFTEMIIQERKKLLQDKEIDEDCVYPGLDFLLQHHKKNPNELSYKDIKDQINALIFGAFDTSTISVSFTLYLIGHHPQVQEKLHQEIDEFYEKIEDEKFTCTDIIKLRYTDCVMKESLRLYPPGPIIGRQVMRDIQIGDHLIPEGSEVGIVLYHLHRNAEVFPEPEKFIPERFLPENWNDKHPFAYLPFSAGPRNCVGLHLARIQQMTLILRLLRHYKIESQGNLGDVRPCLQIFLKPSEKIRIKFSPRKI